MGFSFESKALVPYIPPPPDNEPNNIPFGHIQDNKLVLKNSMLFQLGSVIGI